MVFKGLRAGEGRGSSSKGNPNSISGEEVRKDGKMERRSGAQHEAQQVDTTDDCTKDTGLPTDDGLIEMMMMMMMEAPESDLCVGEQRVLDSV